jgi:hypothetical protein
MFQPGSANLPPADSSDRKSPFRNPLVYTTLLLLIAFGYVVWTFYSRRAQNRAIEAQAAARRRAQDEQSVEMMGGSSFDILNFYASPGQIHKGDTTRICYGVSNAKQVRLDPPSNQGVWPSYGRCVDVSPSKTTAYTLTIEDAAGHAKSATVTIEVR